MKPSEYIPETLQQFFWDIWKRITTSELTRYLPSLLVLLVGIAVSFYFFFMIRGWYWEQKRSQSAALSEHYEQRLASFEHESTRRITALRERFQQDLESLFSLRELFTTSDYVSWSDFRKFTSVSLERHPEIEGVFWIPRIPSGKADQFLEAYSNNGPPVPIPEEHAETLSESNQNPTWPIHYASPPSENRQWLGVNAYRHPFFRDSLRRSLSVDHPAFSYMFSSSGGFDRNHFMAFLNMKSPGTVAPINGRLLSHEGGFVGSLFNVRTLVEHALDPFENRNIEFFIFAPNGQTLIQRGKSARIIHQIGDLETLSQNLPMLKRKFDVLGINWTVVTLPSEGLTFFPERSSQLQREAWIILIVGLFLSLITSGYLWSLLKEISRRRQAEKELKRIARLDPLTDLYNRRTFFDRFNKEFQREERYEHPLTLIMIDIDHFKEINDEHGHQKGDDVLKKISTILMENSRESDVLGRYGGEEFVIALPETSADEAIALADRIREQLKNTTYTAIGGEEFHVTCSAGIAEKSEGTPDPETLLDQADQALYQAKQTGRDKTVLHSEH